LILADLLLHFSFCCDFFRRSFLNWHWSDLPSAVGKWCPDPFWKSYPMVYLNCSKALKL
jgi:hypothetical protein